MKLPNIRPLYKFCIGLVAYALIIWAVSFVDDYRASVFAVMCLGALTFAMALWALVRNDKAVCLILCGCIVAAPLRASDHPKQNPKPDAVVAVVVGCGCLIVGGYIIYTLWKICKHLPGPSNTNNPPATNSLTDLVAPSASTNGPVLIMPTASISELNNWDTAVLTFQSSTNGRDWRNELTASNWFNDTQFVSILYSNRVPLMTNFGMAQWSTNDSPPLMVSDFSAVMPKAGGEPLKLWRTVNVR